MDPAKNLSDTLIHPSVPVKAENVLFKYLLSFAAISILALVLTVPFALRGYHGDDSQFHFDSWIAMRQAWLAGNLAPGWDALANYKLGDPRFCFYPPLSIWLGAALCIILPLRLAPAAFVWLGLVLSACSMYVASRFVIGSRSAIAAAFLYMLGPYILMSAITRFAVAELLVLAWLPLILLHFLRATLELNHKSMLLFGGLLGLSWLTNLPGSIVLAYTLLPAAGIAAIRLRSLKPLFAACVGEIIGVLLAAFALLPAYFETRWITTSALLHQDFRDYFLFYSASGLHRAHFMLGFWVIGGVESVLILAAALVLRRKWNPYQRSLLEVTAIAFLFQIPVTTILWIYAPGLRFVQFPFRFLAMTGAVLPLVTLGNNQNRRFSQTVFLCVALLGLLPLFFYLRISPNAPTALPNLSLAERIGHPGTDEYTPSGASTQTAPISLPAVTPEATSSSTCHASVLASNSGTEELAIDATDNCRLRLPTYFYPYWRAIDEGRNRLQTIRNAAGLLVVVVPPGMHKIQIQFRADSGLRRLSMAISLITILLLLVGLSNQSRTRTRKQETEDTRSLSRSAENDISVSALTTLVPELNPVCMRPA